MARVDKKGAERFRVLIVMDDHPLTKVVAFALNHGVYVQRMVEPERNDRGTDHYGRGAGRT